MEQDLKYRKKWRWLRIIMRTLVVLAGVLIIASLIFDHFVQFRKSDHQLIDFFAQNSIPGHVRYDSSGERPIRYVTIGSDTLPTIFFLHGSPSSLSIYEKYFSDTFFIRNFRMIAADRPGYGGSGFGNPEPSIEKQADLLWPILRPLRTNGKPVLIVAGSYGTSVACRLLMHQPQSADGVLLVAPSLAPGEEKVYWFTELVESPLVNWFIPRMFQSANREKINHFRELEKMLGLWHKITVPVYYLQGANDRLIYTSNAAFAQQKLISAPYLNIEFLKDRPHFFAFSDRPVIRQKILDLYKYVSDNMGNKNR